MISWFDKGMDEAVANGEEGCWCYDGFEIAFVEEI